MVSCNSYRHSTAGAVERVKIKKRYDKNKELEKCCKKKEKSNNECYLDVYGK